MYVFRTEHLGLDDTQKELRGIKLELTSWNLLPGFRSLRRCCASCQGGKATSSPIHILHKSMKHKNDWPEMMSPMVQQ